MILKLLLVKLFDFWEDLINPWKDVKHICIDVLGNFDKLHQRLEASKELDGTRGEEIFCCLECWWKYFPFSGVASHLLCSRLCEPTVVPGASQGPQNQGSPNALLRCERWIPQ